MMHGEREATLKEGTSSREQGLGVKMSGFGQRISAMHEW